MRRLLAILALAATLAFGVGTAPAGANHEWDSPHAIFGCVATTGGVCPL
jgi:hypothetical protein